MRIALGAAILWCALIVGGGASHASCPRALVDLTEAVAKESIVEWWEYPGGIALVRAVSAQPTERACTENDRPLGNTGYGPRCGAWTYSFKVLEVLKGRPSETLALSSYVRGVAPVTIESTEPRAVETWSPAQGRKKGMRGFTTDFGNCESRPAFVLGGRYLAFADESGVMIAPSIASDGDPILRIAREVAHGQGASP